MTKQIAEILEAMRKSEERILTFYFRFIAALLIAIIGLLVAHLL